jgi:hypothetical protein
MGNFVKKGIRIFQIELLYKEGNQNMFSERTNTIFILKIY